MKKLTFFFIVLIIFLSFVAINAGASRKDFQLASPVIKQENVLGVNQWFPAVFENKSDAPQVSARAAMFIDTKNGEVLYSKNIHEKLPVASLVKIMTVLVALEHKSMDEQYLVSKRAAEMEPDKMLLIAGEKLTLRELLYGIFLVSANDAAEVLAEGTTDSREEFIKLMNAKARQLGTKNTFFVNPTGLDEDSGSSYSTAYDLVVLTRYLIRRYPEVIEISSKDRIYLPKTSDHQDYDMYSGINLLTTYPGVIGFKTGYTPEAGFTLVTLAKREGQEIVGVLLGTEYRRDEARQLLDYSFDKLLK